MKIAQRIFVLYGVIAVVCWAAIDHKKMTVNHLNFLKIFEEEIIAYHRGSRQFKVTWAQQVMKYYRHLLKYLPDNVLIYSNMGSTYFYLGDYKHAEDFYKKTIELMPIFYSAYYDLGVVYFAQGNEQEARENFAKSYELAHKGLNYTQMNLFLRQQVDLPTREQEFVRLLLALKQKDTEMKPHFYRVSPAPR